MNFPPSAFTFIKRQGMNTYLQHTHKFTDEPLNVTSLFVCRFAERGSFPPVVICVNCQNLPQFEGKAC